MVSGEVIHVRGIDIDFVTIGNAGNAGDVRTEANPYGCGAVGYEYRIGTYEVTADQWQTINTAGGIGNAGSWSGSEPIALITWYDAARFCNYLTTGDTEDGVYKFSGGSLTEIMDHEQAGQTYGAVYFLPTETEWYKAAYYKPDGSGYSTFSDGGDTNPVIWDMGWNADGGPYELVWEVGTGTQEQNGTFDMMGNVWEWNETLIGTRRILRGGAFSIAYEGEYNGMASSEQYHITPLYVGYDIGFRVAAIIPEPGTLCLFGAGALLMRKRRL